MALESIIEAVRNRKTQKVFILVDDTLDMKFRVINPQGEVLVLPEALFEEDRLSVATDQFKDTFSSEQLTALSRFNEQVASQARVQTTLMPTPKSESEPKKNATPRAPRGSSAKSTVGNTKRGLGATWNAPRLTFYRHKIDPLHLKQTFRIIVEGHGDFEISKEEFLAQFNDVVMSPTYRSDGLYSYPSFPEKARRYMKS